MDLSVVAPACNEQEVLPVFIQRTTAVLDSYGGSWELVIVDDGSSDGTWEVVLAASERDPRIHGVRLARNFGHQLALTAGLAASDGDAVITLDSDLQHPPELVPELVNKARAGYDVVYAVRSPDDEAGVWKRLSAKVFYRALNRLTALELPEGAADFRYMSRRVVNVLLAMPERHRFLRGMTRWTGFEQAFVPYKREARENGRSKYGLAKMLLLAWDAVTSFSAVPLRVAGHIGVLVSLLGWAYLVYAILAHLLTNSTISGWTSVTAAVLVLGGVQLICLGIFGQYLGRMYEDIKRRPLFLIAEDTHREDVQPALPEFDPTLLAGGSVIPPRQNLLSS
jgi:glycosyltransferase involved in cell wall biosynthesis